MEVHTEAITCRDELLLIPAKLVESSRQKTLKLGVGAKWWAAIKPSLQATPALLGHNCSAVGLSADLPALPVLEQTSQPGKLAGFTLALISQARDLR